MSGKLSIWKRITAKAERIIDKQLKLVLTGVQTSEKAVALTFDDGPHPRNTPRLLDILDKYEAKATFFVVGEAAQKHPQIIDRIIRSGHAIGNHTWDHTPIPLIARKQRIKQIQETREVLPSNREMLFRPPWGFLTLAAYLDIKMQGCEVVLWNAVAYDWLGFSADEFFQRLNKAIKPGNIILMHDQLYHSIKPEYKSRDAIFTALEEALAKYHASYKFVTVPHLKTLGRPQYSRGIKSKKEGKNLVHK